MMITVVKGVAAGVVALTLYVILRPVSGLPERQFPGGLRPEDLAAWVVERNFAVTPVPPTRQPSSPITGSHTTVANRNRNPLNIKLGSETRRYVDLGLATISDIIPTDGGRFLRFGSPETGFRVAAELLNTKLYEELRIEHALGKWSNNGYGTEILSRTRLDGGRRVSNLGPDDLQILLTAMAAAEGYKSPTISDEIRKALDP